MSVYRMPELNVTSSVVALQAERLFNLTSEPVLHDGVYYVVEGDTTFEMDKATGAIWYADYTKLWDASYSPNLPALNTCRYLADQFLSRNGLMPSNAIFTDFGSVNAAAFNIETKERQLKTLSVQVNYGLELESFPVVGPSGRISVNIGSNGEIIGLNWAWRDVEFLDSFSVLDFEGILARAVGEYVREEHLIVYYWSPDFDHDFLQPMYQVKITSSAEGEECNYVKYVPATNFSPAVDIISPEPGNSFSEGDPIFINCTVSSGTPPYNFIWESSLDGLLSNESSFTTSSLSIGSRNNTVLPHTITLRVVDANGLECEDAVLITIERKQLPWDIIALFIIVLVVLVAIFLWKRKKLALVLFLFATLGFSFTTLPLASANSGIARRELAGKTTLSAYDDSDWEVAVEWLTYPVEVEIEILGISFRFTVHDLPYSDDLAKRFYNKIGSYAGWNKEFEWGNGLAWEEDFKYQSIGGTDHIWIDTVDIALFSGHGGPSGFRFTTNFDDTWLSNNDARWGDGDLEWIALDACECLRDTSGGQFAEERWGPALQGAHMILGFDTTNTDVKTRGEKWAQYMKTWTISIFGMEYTIEGLTVKNAWFKACRKTEGSDTRAAVVYGTRADDPWNPPLNDPSNDHLHGQGYVSSDPIPAKWWVYISVQC